MGKNKETLRKTRENLIINQKSKKEDLICRISVLEILEQLADERNLNIVWEKTLHITDAVEMLKKKFPNVSFGEPNNNKSYISPDGGISYLLGRDERKYPILVAEMKNQGTNDLREAEGKSKQSVGNAVERLGKNVIALRTLMADEDIFPFVCFGDGCDFDKGSSILDRVFAIAMFGELNTDHTKNEGENGMFNRGNYYFRRKSWTAEEIKEKLENVAKISVEYYLKKYLPLKGDDYFTPLPEEPQKTRKSRKNL